MEKIEASITSAGGYTGRRMAKDKLFKYLMTFGGVSVIVAISTIFFYLASVVAPLFYPPHMDTLKSLPVVPQSGQTTVYVATEEQVEIGMRVSDKGGVTFFDLRDGKTLLQEQVATPKSVSFSSFGYGDPRKRTMAFGLKDGRVVLFKDDYQVSFLQDPENPKKDIRSISPGLVYPLGEEALQVDDAKRSIKQLTVQHDGEETTVVALTEDDRLLLAHYVSESDFTGETISVKRDALHELPKLEGGIELPKLEGGIEHLLLEIKQRDLYVFHGGRFVSHFDVQNKDKPTLKQTVAVVPEGERITAATLLSGGFSLILGTDKGNLSQWFQVRNSENVNTLTRIREFKPMEAAVTYLAPEYARKGFVAGDGEGGVNLYYATSERLLLEASTGNDAVKVAAFSPRANAILLETEKGEMQTAHIENEYPEISFSTLWGKVWYESYEKPDYLWQSAAANSDFEPKFSVAPLTFGTLKAAFYAMLVAVPLAVLGAIFAANFMSPKMRSVVKPSIEIMEALPTVILGFLAGLWLAPFVDNNLAGTLMALFMLPFSFLITAYIWQLLPRQITERVGPGWEAAVLVPVIIVVMWIAVSLGHPLEAAFFNGDMPRWVTNELGWTYEQRNSLVVGIAMGFAVIPTIFSIAEDAVFSVPKHLSSGSLALGATPWQTLYHVVLLTASPGIFSAVMVGMGRAVGETMIVLMATGNTAVMDLSIFTGFRTLSANIGVEMPEAAVGSTHYLLLFFSALVLFAFTFCVNTLAELVRQRLREKYSSI
ncbi:MAG: ABC transporter permease subunit [Gallionella sp.]|nr:ABC transporter permease subunit [Gallionella sp.]